MTQDDVVPGYPFFAPDWTEDLKPVLYLIKVAYETSAIGEYDYLPNFSLNLLNEYQTYLMKRKYLEEWVWTGCQFDNDEDVWTMRGN